MRPVPLGGLPSAGEGEGEGEGEGGSALAPTDVPFAVFPPTLLENVC